MCNKWIDEIIHGANFTILWQNDWLRHEDDATLYEHMLAG
jgi:hypothetical protein